jgi:hypothetical protein
MIHSTASDIDIFEAINPVWKDILVELARMEGQALNNLKDIMAPESLLRIAQYQLGDVEYFRSLPQRIKAQVDADQLAKEQTHA